MLFKLKYYIYIHYKVWGKWWWWNMYRFLCIFGGKNIFCYDWAIHWPLHDVMLYIYFFKCMEMYRISVGKVQGGLVHSLMQICKQFAQLGKCNYGSFLLLTISYSSWSTPFILSSKWSGNSSCLVKWSNPRGVWKLCSMSDDKMNTGQRREIHIYMVKNSPLPHDMHAHICWESRVSIFIQIFRNS